MLAAGCVYPAAPATLEPFLAGTAPSIPQPANRCLDVELSSVLRAEISSPIRIMKPEDGQGRVALSSWTFFVIFFSRFFYHRRLKEARKPQAKSAASRQRAPACEELPVAGYMNSLAAHRTRVLRGMSKARARGMMLVKKEIKHHPHRSRSHCRRRRRRCDFGNISPPSRRFRVQVKETFAPSHPRTLAPLHHRIPCQQWQATALECFIALARSLEIVGQLYRSPWCLRFPGFLFYFLRALRP